MTVEEAAEGGRPGKDEVHWVQNSNKEGTG